MERQRSNRRATSPALDMRTAALVIFALAAGCGDAAERPEPQDGNAVSSTEPPVLVTTTGPDVSGRLAGTSWRLVEFQSMDDAQGTTRPDDPSRYTMRLGADGTVAMRLDCNRATGRWSAEPGTTGSSGRFELGPLAVTEALCAPPTMGEMLARQARYIRSYVLEEGRLYLALMADGGIYVWEPAAPGG